ncbi:conjugal transfer protein [Alicyclobacillus macrosporangiidus]|uniref:conjugal transfer protein n=1 Tax=Alicyclobacillus macrosporangiidus TaxID=392015 RepID=UPI0004977C13|nr:conjugal transfer protein [Alicyclobacillus macrosporangiidus]
MPRSYQKLFKQKTVITNLNRHNLGFRLFADDLVTFLLAAFILMLLDSYTPLILVNFVMNRWLFIAGGAFLFTWAARKLDPDGKPLVRYLFGAVAYPFRSHVSDGWTKKARQLVWRRGKVTRRKEAAKVVWTRGDLPLSVKVYGENWSFESGIHLDVYLRRGRTVLRKAGRFRRPGRHRVSGLRPGRYEIQGRRLLRRED